MLYNAVEVISMPASRGVTAITLTPEIMYEV